jgi:putative nucleotidyltransferase with HDIG domain
MSPTPTFSLGTVHPRELPDIVAEIPTLPDVYQHLFARMQDPDVAVPQIAEIIARDQALSAKILHLVNSAFYGYNQPIGSISRAVVVLGFRAVRGAALALGVFDYFRDEASTGAFDLKSFWTHSIGVASVAKVLAEQTGEPPPEEAFVVGLLHDVGKLIEKRFFPADFDAITAKVRDEEESWLEAEKKLFAIDHARMAGVVFRSWKLPSSVVTCVGHHHRPLATQDWAQLTALLHLADLAAHELDLGIPGHRPPGPPCLDALKLLNIQLPLSTEVEEQIRSEVQRSLAILDLLN